MLTHILFTTIHCKRERAGNSQDVELEKARKIWLKQKNCWETMKAWIGRQADIRNERRAGSMWCKVKARLQHTLLSKRQQAEVFNACVESGLLFDLAVRPWNIPEIKLLQICSSNKSHKRQTSTKSETSPS